MKDQKKQTQIPQIRKMKISKIEVKKRDGLASFLKIVSISLKSVVYMPFSWSEERPRAHCIHSYDFAGVYSLCCAAKNNEKELDYELL